MTQKIILEDAFKKYTLDQDKIITPEETLKKFKGKLTSLNLDILDKTQRIDTGRLGIPVYLSLCTQNAQSITGTKKQMGKGATPQQAEASAVMELAERFSFFSFCKTSENFFVEQSKNLKEKAISFDQIAKSVHDSSDELDITRDIFENLHLKWTSAYNLTRNEEVLVPFDWFYAINEFNGPSAGNCQEEAISQGICEIVERHVSSLISQNQMEVPLIDTSAVTEPLVLEMLQKYKNTGISLFLSDFSLDIGIPTVGVLAYDPSTFPEKSEIVWTAGTTPDPQKALSRGLTEVAQLAGDFNTGSNYVASGLPKFNTLSEADFITNTDKIIPITDLPNVSNNNIKIEIQNCISALEKKKMEVILINTMHTLLEIPAFYTIIPGAHFRERAIGTSVGMFSAKHITDTMDPRQAYSELNKINVLLPDKYYVKFYQGLCCININDPQSALEHFKSSLDLHPTRQDVPTIYSYMGVALKEMERYTEAISVLKEGLKFDQERTDIFNLLGFCYFKLKEHKKAIENFKKVIQLDPSSAIDYANIASNYRDMGEKEKAIHYYQIALDLNPSIEFARSNLDLLLNS
jgi:ribosomal protein S12 methylthiotransferase accessory factor